MDIIYDRQEAGALLVDLLSRYKHNPDVIVLALPRGGVSVGKPLSVALEAPLDVLVVRKLGMPHHEEYAIGAISSFGSPIYNEEIIQSAGISRKVIRAIEAREREELNRREALYRRARAPLDVNNKIVILVDDGIATGATMFAAIMALKQQRPKKIIVAVPVCSEAMFDVLLEHVDECYVLMKPNDLIAVGQWYQHFEQVSDDEVIAMLHSNARS